MLYIVCQRMVQLHAYCNDNRRLRLWGGAGIQADLKTFQELEVFGTSVITALTAQNTLGVSGVCPIDVSFIKTI